MFKYKALHLASIASILLTSSVSADPTPLKISLLSKIEGTVPVLHRILGLHLGQTASEARTVAQAHVGGTFTERNAKTRHKRNSGVEVGYSYISQIYSKLKPQNYEGKDKLVVTLGTDALEGRVIGITRDVTLTSDHTQTTDELVKTMLDTYGDPSLIHTGTRIVTLLYAYDAHGFVKDLKEVSEYLFATQSADRIHNAYGYDFHGDVPCLTMETNLSYKFYAKRYDLDRPRTCSALLRIELSRFRSPVQMRFTLEDHAAARAQTKYLDELIKGPPVIKTSPKIKF